MQLIQAKVRCVDGVKDTGWFVPGRETTVVVGPHGSGKTALLKALQALNPAYDIERVRPFADHPLVWHQHGYLRKVIPWKKTAGYLVFSARPEQVVRLAEIDFDLIETDRIEIGRRLDNSRWISFVELAASSRWREIAGDMMVLRLAIANGADGPESGFFAGLRESDRLQGDLAAQCLAWLESVQPFVGAEQKERYGRCLHHITRRQRFFKAEESVARELPLTLYHHPETVPPPVLPLGELRPDRLRGKASPVTDLLSRIYPRSTSSHPGVRLEQLQAEAAMQLAPLVKLFHENGWPIPALRSDDRQVYFTNIPKTVLYRRLYQIGLICILAQLCHAVRPVLLLDCCDHGLGHAEKLEIIRFLQGLGSWCQIVVATADETVAGAAGWQARYRIGPGGLQESGMSPF